MRYVFLIALTIALAGCTTKVSCRSFSLNLAADEGRIEAPGLYRELSVANQPSEKLLVLRKPAFDGGDIGKASFTTVDTIFSGSMMPSVFLKKETLVYHDPAVDIRFKESVKKKLLEFSSQHIGDKLAVVLDEAVLTAPVIRESLPDGVVIISGSITEEDAHRIVDRLNLISGCR